MGERPDQSGDDTIVSGATSAWLAQVSIYALGFVASVLIARALGPAGRGEYYLPVTAAATALALVHVTLESANTYFFAERRLTLDRLAQNAGALAPVLGALGIGLMAAAFGLTRDSVFAGVDARDYAIAAAVLPVQLHLLWLTGILQLAKRVSKTQRALAAGALVQVALIAALYLADELTVTAVLGSYALSLVVPWLLQMRAARGLVRLRPRFDPGVVRPVLAFATRLHIGMVFAFLLLRADVFLVGAYLDPAAVGVYSLAVIFCELALTLTVPLATAALPYQSEAGFKEAGELSFRVARTNAVIAIALALAFAGSLWLVFPSLYGEGFEDAYGALVVLLPGVVAMALARPLGTWLVRTGKPFTMGSIAFAAFMLNLGLNVLFIPALGITGASLASTISYLIFGAAFVLWGLRVSRLPWRAALMPRREELEQLRDFLIAGVRRSLPTGRDR